MDGEAAEVARAPGSSRGGIDDTRLSWMSLRKASRYLFFSCTLWMSVAVWLFEQASSVYEGLVEVTSQRVSIVCMINVGIAFVWFANRVLQYYFFGSLRQRERDDLMDRTKLALLDLLFALTLFREEISARTVMLLVMLLFIRYFHWLTAYRLDFLDTCRNPVPQLRRLLGLIFLLFWSDLFVANYFLSVVVRRGFSMELLFASEFLVLLFTSMALAGKYFIIVYNIHFTVRQVAIKGYASSQWSEKDGYIFFVNVARDILQSLTYFVFFGVIFVFYGIPIHMMRELFMSISSLVNRIQDLRRYLVVSRLEQVKFFAEDEAEDCGVCFDRIDEGRQLPCGHKFHSHCLLKWLSDHNSCPICKSPVFDQHLRLLKPRNGRGGAIPSTSRASSRDDSSSSRPNPGSNVSGSAPRSPPPPPPTFLAGSFRGHTPGFDTNHFEDSASVDDIVDDYEQICNELEKSISKAQRLVRRLRQLQRV